MKRILPLLLVILVSCTKTNELDLHFEIPGQPGGAKHQAEWMPKVDVVNLSWDYLDENEIPKYIQISSSWGNIALPIEDKRALKIDRKLFKKNDSDAQVSSDLMFLLIYFADVVKISEDSVEIEGVVLSRQYDATINQNQTE